MDFKKKEFRKEEAEELVNKIEWLIKIRWIGIILGFFIFFLAERGEISGFFVFRSTFILFVWAFLNFFYALALKKRKALQFNVYFQLFLDALILSVNVHYEGGVASFVSSLIYVLIIMAAAILLSLRASIFVATVSSIFYALVIAFEYFRILSPIPVLGLEVDLYKDGFNVSLAVFIKILFFYGIAFLAGYLSDSLREKNRQLSEAKSKIEEMNQRLKEFISIASHQLRTPLSSIKWLLEMLLNKEAEKVLNGSAGFLEKIYQSNQRMIALVNDFLDVSRIEGGKIQTFPQRILLDEIVRKQIGEFSSFARAHNIEIVFDSSKIPSEIFADPIRIKQVLQNLIDNAVKYTKGKGEIRIKIEKKEKEVIVSIKDQGIGIPKEQQNKIFTKFFRADNVLTINTQGTGLGLYIAKAIIESSKGRMWFESEEGKGSTFYFSLPLINYLELQNSKS